MSTQNSQPDVPIRRVDRILAFTALGIAAASVICFFAIIIGTALGMDQKAFGHGAWPVIAFIPYWGSPRLRDDHHAADHELHPEGSRIATLRAASS